MPPLGMLLLAEGLTVSALIHGGICLVGAHHNAIQGTVVLGVAVICTLLDGALNALICVTVHCSFLLFVWYSGSMTHFSFLHSSGCILEIFVLLFIGR